MKKTLNKILSISVICVYFGSCDSNKLGLISDFETEELVGWNSTGDLSLQSYKTELLPKNVEGFVGAGVLNTGHDHPEKMGTLTSPEFIINKKYINFLITGNRGYNAERDCNVRIVIDGEVVKFAPPTRFPLVEWGAIDLSEFEGKTAHFEVFDKSRKHFIIIDQISQSDELALGVEELSFKVSKKYLLFPVSKGGAQYRFRLEKEGDLSEQFVVEMKDGEPDYWAFKDLSNFQGKEIKLRTYSPTSVKGLDKIYLSNEVPDEDKFYKEKERPQFHFTSKTGWINDPNGLVYNKGVWHLMYQHNPYGVIGSLKHWGHAVSTNLVDWTENPSSLVPDDLGSNHSGGAVVDFNNSAGLQTGDDKTLVAFWTSAGHFSTPSSRFTQSISYSTDNGKTWRKYAGNPIIDFIAGRNRDPNVLWHEEAKIWVMSLYIDDNEYAIFNSNNLTDWILTDRIIMPAAECPDIFQLNLDGNSNNRKWIFWGGNGNYVVGDFDGKTFDIEGEAHKTHFGDYYAAMTYSNAPDNRIVQTAWLRKWPFPNTNFRMQMSISNDITLRTSPDGNPVLYSYPVKELESLRTDSFVQKNISLTQTPFIPDFKAELMDLNVIAEVKKNGVLKMKVRGEEIVYNRNENTISYKKEKIELLTDSDTQEFRILVDRASVEIFCNGGEKALFLAVGVDANNKIVEFTSEGAKSDLSKLEIFSLNSSWAKM
ncbi:glycoside hydrolase family 32 protein [Arenibacter palladensis]|uniref:glycoside hydrolase family 32 protein n=1 Tax=Arenibacter palladensis TaxID=237373 RepID=UPI0026E1297D|nr:glycoside hydrolase family 32 protein [Arenibacter palladensis]MDO6602854.1 glycoside hydrolase family 32 protein [Arenibacter palladensis]